MSGHSVIAPSSAARRIQCPQSTTLEALFPETEDSIEAAEGVAAHWAVSEMLSGRLVDVGVIAPNGLPLTQQMVDAADAVYDDVTRELAPYGLKPSDGRAECQVRIPRVHADSFGTPDWYIVIQLAPNKYLVLLYDFKFGHRFVEVFENPQLVEYLAGVTHGISDALNEVQIVAKIAQPRAYHRQGSIRAWRTSLLALRALINVSSNAAHEALGPAPRARVGPECRDCRARHACPALQAAGFAAMDEARRVEPEELTVEAAALERKMVLRAIELLKARDSGLEQQLLAHAKAGRQVPGWRIEHGSGREKWTRPDAEIIAVAAALGVNVAKPVEAMTPNQAREAGLNLEVVQAFTTRPRAAATLVEDDGSKLRSIFG